MASITIPTPIEVTASVLSQYVIDGDSASIQTLFNDTNFTAEDYCLKYNGLPIFCVPWMNGSNRSGCMYYPTANGRGISISGSGNDNYFTSSNTMYFYLFETFIVITEHYDITITDYSTRNVCIVDKTNLEVFDASSFDGHYSYGLLGIYFGYLEEGTPVYDRYYPTQSTSTSNQNNAGYRTLSPREESVEECTYIPLMSWEGKTATRVVMMTKFPRASSNSILHVGDKYFYITPYDETVRSFYRCGYDEAVNREVTQESMCTLAIDVTSEVS